MAKAIQLAELYSSILIIVRLERLKAENKPLIISVNMK